MVEGTDRQLSLHTLAGSLSMSPYTTRESDTAQDLWQPCDNHHGAPRGREGRERERERVYNYHKFMDCTFSDPLTKRVHTHRKRGWGETEKERARAREGEGEEAVHVQRLHHQPSPRSVLTFVSGVLQRGSIRQTVNSGL